MKDKYVYETTLLKSYNAILIPIVSDLVNTRISENITMLDLMSGSAIKDLIIGCIDMYAKRNTVVDIEHCEYGEKPKLINRDFSPFVYPKNLVETVKTLEGVYEKAMSPDMLAGPYEIHTRGRDAMVKRCYDGILNYEGIKLGRR